jgi:hypothetical protein
MLLVWHLAQVVCTLQVKSISSLTKTRGPLPLIDSLSLEPDSLLLVDDPEACEPGREIGKTRIGLVDLSPGICDRRVS